ncbi:MAG TPA: cell wall hydrolase [Allosphingosinicella sp.]|jgi:spore germination cell wall hydrolase CwlJ-like protein
MRTTLRAAALTAAALSFFAAGALPGPLVAAQSEAAPKATFAEHGATTLTAANLGINDLQDTTAPGVETDVSTPVATHAIAPAAPETTLGQEPDETVRRSLSELVGDYSSSDTPDAETDCLARAVYWEAKGEPLAGQLTVAEVIINRSNSGRFASTVCGVVRQAGQFSFVRRGSIPAAPRASRDWRIAVAIAQIAMQDLADGSAPRALFFHARRVHPGWRLTRVATVGNHVFYR